MLKKVLILFLVCGLSIHATAQDDKLHDFESFDITKVGQAVPDFSFTIIDGTTYQMSELKGKTILLVFFATWCAPCMKELPQIQTDIWNKYKSDDFMVVALGRDHSMEEIIAFNEKKGFTFPIGPDPGKEIYSKFFSNYIPRNVLVNKDGIIVYQKQGYREEDSIKLIELITQLTK